MAIQATVETTFGEDRDCYIVFNNWVQFAGHLSDAIANFHGFRSREDYKAERPMIWQGTVTFPLDKGQDGLKQAYAALKGSDPTLVHRETIAELEDRLNRANATVQEATYQHGLAETSLSDAQAALAAGSDDEKVKSRLPAAVAAAERAVSDRATAITEVQATADGISAEIAKKRDGDLAAAEKLKGQLAQAEDV